MSWKAYNSSSLIEFASRRKLLFPFCLKYFRNLENVYLTVPLYYSCLWLKGKITSIWLVFEKMTCQTQVYSKIERCIYESRRVFAKFTIPNLFSHTEIIPAGTKNGRGDYEFPLHSISIFLPLWLYCYLLFPFCWVVFYYVLSFCILMHFTF